MSEWMAAHPRARAVVLVAAGLVVGLVLLAFILAGIDRVSSSTAGEPDTDSPPAPVPSPAGGEPSPAVPETSPGPPSTTEVEDERPTSPLPDLPDTDDPDVYAAAIAEVLFGMDYANHAPGDYEAFFAAALWDEILDEDRARILTTINRRIPAADMWEQMRTIEQTSEFEVELVWEPRLAQTYQDRGDWPAGWAMRTISGTQTETWQAPDEDEQTSTRPAAVTIAMACRPASSPCRLIGIGPHVES